MTKKKRGKSILRRQKPRKRRSSRRRKAIFTLGFLFVLAGSGVGTYYLYQYGSQLVAQMLLPSQPEEKITWTVELASGTQGPLTSAVHEKILSLASKSLKTGEKSELTRVAKQIRRSGLFGRVSVTRVGEAKVVIAYQERQAYAEVAGGFWLSTEGQIYTAKVEPISPLHEILCSGFWPPGQEPKARYDRSLPLTDQQAQQVRDAMALIEEFAERGIRITALEHIPFRGFEVTLAGVEVRVAIGNTPFGVKLDRLEKILSGKQGVGPDISRIELDYQGKAFVKKRKS